MARFKALTASFRNAHSDICPVYINQRKVEIPISHVCKSKYFTYTNILIVDKVGGRDSVECIAISHELDGPGIELRWGDIYDVPSKTCPAAYSVSNAMPTASVPGIKRSGHIVENPNPFMRSASE